MRKRRNSSFRRAGAVDHQQVTIRRQVMLATSTMKCSTMLSLLVLVCLSCFALQAGADGVEVKVNSFEAKLQQVLQCGVKNRADGGNAMVPLWLQTMMPQRRKTQGEMRTWQHVAHKQPGSLLWTRGLMRHPAADWKFQPTERQACWINELTL